MSLYFQSRSKSKDQPDSSILLLHSKHITNVVLKKMK
jgi:hypothetical protein